MTPLELKAALDRKETLHLIDVREAEEWDTVHLAGAKLMPLAQFQRLATRQLSPDETIVVYCHHGIRSAAAQRFLQSEGYEKVINLTGGIDAWAQQVDPTMKRY